MSVHCYNGEWPLTMANIGYVTGVAKMNEEENLRKLSLAEKKQL